MTAGRIPATRVGVVRLQVRGDKPTAACPRCGIRRQIRYGRERLCADCRLVDPDFGKKGA